MQDICKLKKKTSDKHRLTRYCQKPFLYFMRHFFFIFGSNSTDARYPKISAADTPTAQALKPPWNNPKTIGIDCFSDTFPQYISET